ncbi:hypothetical protein [Micromonospora alfalfae]|nr:hypothetical protein [Micromonospora alfalfae]
MAQSTCSCGRCGVCTAVITAALKREAYPPVQRNGVGAAVKTAKR